MTEKKQIVLIYSVVAIVCSLIIGMSVWLATLKKTNEELRPYAEDMGKVEVTEIMSLERDLDLVKQDGEAVKISDLKDKVWIATQFFAICPMCAERNGTRLLQVYDQFKDNPNFKVVCFSVDPESDTDEHLMSLETGLGVDGDKWWFVKTDPKKLRDYMRFEMLFGSVTERTDPREIDEKGKWAHDMGIQVYRGDTLLKKWHEGLPPEQLTALVAKALEGLSEEGDE
ncbi:SCO family protein [Akkermansiaceae bacterium]|nr:SCO family protein [Akkermansiaceae bacterium]MDB4288881.1 SCO family protein [bacterium]MDB0055606.1 SCO family protein [Akkermansiaceae bacterium]MDB4041160.1 SCO family protein [Akkermansiaceae bacterium]MDB4297024.1 SCO family protein [Akkermansiaceae bacterium]